MPVEMGSSASPKPSDGRPVPIRELSIYDPSPRPVPMVVAQERSNVDEQIASVRRVVWKGLKRASAAYSTAVAHTNESVQRLKDFAEYVRVERGVLPRVTAVGLTGLAGLVFAGRRAGRLQRAFYFTVFTGAATTVSWPQQTKERVLSAYRFAQKKSASYQVERSEVSASMALPEESAPVVKAVEESAVVLEKSDVDSHEPPKDNVSEPESSVDSPAEQPSDSDYGQSNPADKDLYSTRV